MFERSQLTPQQVRRYVNEVNHKRKDILQKYIQLSTEAKVMVMNCDDIDHNTNHNPKLISCPHVVLFLSQVTAETLLLESKYRGKAILDLISILNITNLVFGIKKLPCTWSATTYLDGIH